MQLRLAVTPEIKPITTKDTKYHEGLFSFLDLRVLRGDCSSIVVEDLFLHAVEQ
jgi:hypothetical protein